MIEFITDPTVIQVTQWFAWVAIIVTAIVGVLSFWGTFDRKTPGRDQPPTIVDGDAMPVLLAHVMTKMLTREDLLSLRRWFVVRFIAATVMIWVLLLALLVFALAWSEQLLLPQ